MNTIPWDSRRFTALPLAHAAALALVSILVAPAAAATGACSATTRLAFDACMVGTQEDFLLADADCVNIKSARLRLNCQVAVRAEILEVREECAEQRDARQKLCRKLGEAPYEPVYTRSKFVTAAAAAAAPNPYFPLVPGMRWVYDADDESVVVEVLDEIKTIAGVQCRTVRDTVTVEIAGHDHLVEDTDDWFAQDVQGNVWYCGEISQNFEYIAADGEVELVDVEGSWKTLRDGAKPGIVMPAAPRVGQVYRQEFDLGEAEDAARVVSVTGSATASIGSCSGNCLITREFSPLEPGHEEIKIYSPGYGLILEIDPETREVKSELVEMTAPLIPM